MILLEGFRLVCYVIVPTKTNASLMYTIVPDVGSDPLCLLSDVRVFNAQPPCIY